MVIAVVSSVFERSDMFVVSMYIGIHESIDGGQDVLMAGDVV